jgi:hypothetical protein
VSRLAGTYRPVATSPDFACIAAVASAFVAKPALLYRLRGSPSRWTSIA